MFTRTRRGWRRLASRVRSVGPTRPDPKVQLERAITEAQEQHRRLLDRCAETTATRDAKLSELALALEDLEKVSAHTKQAVLMADESAQRGNDAKVAEFSSAAESFAGRLVADERRLADVEERALQAARHADEAHLDARDTATALQQGLEDRLARLTPADQAALQERMKVVMASLSAPTDEDGPTEAELRSTIERRHAQAEAESAPPDQAITDPPSGRAGGAAGGEARARLAEMRVQLGLDPIERHDLVAPSEPTGEPAPGQVEPA